MRKYGVDNFIFEILEDNISSEQELNEREKYYIQKYNSTSHENGYNIAIGGDGGRISSKLSSSQVDNIISILLDENNIESFSQIGEHFGVESSTIRAINIGETWYNEKLNYPLRKYSTTGLSLTRQQYKEIVDLLLFSTIKLQEIMKKYKLSEQQLSSINNGQYCYNGKHTYYSPIYTGPFPIRKIHKQEKITEENFIPILRDCIYTTQSMNQLGEKYNQKGNTLQYIFSGNRRKELTKNFVTPIRENLKENKKIFEELYGLKEV